VQAIPANKIINPAKTADLINQPSKLPDALLFCFFMFQNARQPKLIRHCQPVPGNISSCSLDWCATRKDSKKERWIA
jgi:hypothetical protein